MSDGRWLDVEADLAAAVRHLSNGVLLYEAGGFDAPGLDGYRAAMAFMHAMQSGHTSLEAALLRVLDIVGEEAPTGARWHADLVRRAAAVAATRPAILSAGLAAAVDETRQFRNLATRGYDSFVPRKALDAVEAARAIVLALAGEIAAFRRAVDPD